METRAEHRIDQNPNRGSSAGDNDDRVLAAGMPPPEARISVEQMQADPRIVEREVRELRAQLARDAAGAAAANERPS